MAIKDKRETFEVNATDARTSQTVLYAHDALGNYFRAQFTPLLNWLSMTRVGFIEKIKP